MPDIATFEGICIGFPVAQSTIRRAVATDVSLGMIQTRQTQSSVSRRTGQRKARVWDLVANRLTDAEVVALRGFFTSTQFGAQSMSFTPPQETVATSVRFAPQSLRIRYARHNHTQAAWRFEERI